MVRYCIGKTPIYLASRIQRFRQENKIPPHILCNIYALYQHIYTYVKSKLRAILFIHIRAHAREGRRPQNRSVSQRGVTEIVCEKTESMANKKKHTTKACFTGRHRTRATHLDRSSRTSHLYKEQSLALPVFRQFAKRTFCRQRYFSPPKNSLRFQYFSSPR